MAHAAVPLLQATQAHCSCPICLNVLTQPLCFPCGHIFCHLCAARCIAGRPRCPLCNHAVPNMRHGIPLPQLSLFCTLAREVGQRLSALHRCRESAAPRGAAGAPGSDGAVAHLKRPRSTSPNDAVAHTPVSSPSSSGSAADEDRDRRLPELLCDAAEATQRLHSESPAPPQTSSPSTQQGSGSAGDVVDGPAPPPPRGLSPRQHSTVIDDGGTCSPMRTSPPPPPPPLPARLSSTPLQSLRAHLAACGDQLDATPRLQSPPSTTAGGEAPNHSCSATRCPPAPSTSAAAAPMAEGHSAARSAHDWRVWRRGRGVVHCSLWPPAARHLLACSGEGGDVACEADATGIPQAHRAGCCVLCGLDVVQRSTVRRRLQQLLSSPAARCDPAELAAQTEESLSVLLGPVWGICCVVQSDAPACAGDGEYRRVAGAAAVDCAAHADATPHQVCCGVAHHNCLAWAGLLDVFTDTSSSETAAPAAAAASAAAVLVPSTTVSLHTTVPLEDPFKVLAAHRSGRAARWQLLAATLWHHQHCPTLEAAELVSAPRCALCEDAAPAVAARCLFGAGLRMCAGSEHGESSCGRQVHYPCALLAGASACLVFGLEEERNMLTAAEDTCVRDRGAVQGPGEGVTGVEVWCGPCHARREARRRRGGQ